MRKLFLFLCAALMSVGMYAATVVTITEADFPTIGKSFTKDGVTITTGDSFSPSHDLLYPTFTSSVGNFTKIEISADNISLTGEGWSGGNTWTGNASGVSTDGDSYVFVFYGSITITCTIEEPEPEPEPAEVTVVFAANSKTVERTVTLPHEFLCSYYNANGELDAIIQELYGISDGHCSDYNYPVASGNEAVLAGSYGDDNYITISAAFEGTATVSGWYWNWDAYDGDGDWMDYSLTISIKGDEPEPTGGLNIVELTPIPASWADDETIFLTPEDLPGFKEVTLEEAMTWTTEYTDDAILFYGFSDVGRAMYVNYYHGEKYHGSSYYYRYTVSWNARVYYTTGGSTPEPIPATYTLQLVADPEKGSVAVTNLLGSNIVDNGNGNYTVPENAEVTILATPNEGYEFAGWKVGNIDDMVGCYYCGTALNTKDNPMTITMTEDKAYLAEFEATASEDVNITPNVDPDHAGVYYSTFYDSQIKYALPAGVEAYVATQDGANLKLSKIAGAGQTIPADNAVIFKSSVTPFTLSISDAEAVQVNAINHLQGTDESINTPDNCYVLAGNDGVGFYHYTASMLNPHKAYVIYSGSNQAPSRMPFIFDQATGVEEVQGDKVQSTKAIENGQLIIIKNGVKYNAIGQIVK